MQEQKTPNKQWFLKTELFLTQLKQSQTNAINTNRHVWHAYWNVMFILKWLLSLLSIQRTLAVYHIKQAI